MWRTYYVDKEAPEEVKQSLREYYMRYSGPAENWNYAHAGSGGTIARRRPYHYEAGLGAGGPHDVIPGVVGQREDTLVSS